MVKMKIVKSNKLYFKGKDEELVSYLQQQLTYEIVEQRAGAVHPRYHCMVGSIGDTYWIPNTRLDLIDTFYKGEVNFEVINKRVEVPCAVPKPSFKLREAEEQGEMDQAEIVADYSEDSIINGKPG